MNIGSESTTPLSERAALLRRAFDQAFAAAPLQGASPAQLFLAIGVGGDSYALHLADVAGVYADKKIVPVPSHSPDLAGIASFRGALVAIYDLRIVLGYPASTPPRWLVLVEQETSVGLAFDQLDGYLALAPEAIAPMTGTAAKRQYLTETVSADDTLRPVIGVAAILEMIRRRTLSAS